MPPDSDTSAAAQTPIRATLPQLAIVTVFIVCYAVLSHYSTTATDAKGLGAGLTIAPILLIGAVMVWRWSHPLLASSIFVLVGGLVFHYWPVLTKYYEWADVAQQCGAYALVAFGFGRSLLGGRVPLCTRITANLHGSLTPAEISYTRKATVAWTLLYALLAVTILILFFAAPLRNWSLFVNFGSFGIMGFAFIADHALRRRVLPHRHGGILAALRHSLAGSS
jgi:uncharacterized membrane protein